LHFDGRAAKLLISTLMPVPLDHPRGLPEKHLWKLPEWDVYRLMSFLMPANQQCHKALKTSTLK